jgi:hypothetical protein
MKFVGRLVSFLVAVVVVGACASTKVSERKILVTEKVPRPDHILIYDFAATPADVPANSPLAAAATAQTPQTPEQIETGRRVGAEIATRLAERVRRMGLPAERASRQSAPSINDIVIRGYLVSVSEGSAAKRVAIGFGAGASELSVAVEGYQMTAQGLRRLGSGAGTAGGSQTPGAAVPADVALAGHWQSRWPRSGHGHQGVRRDQRQQHDRGQNRDDRDGDRQADRAEVPGPRVDQVRVVEHKAVVVVPVARIS